MNIRFCIVVLLGLFGASCGAFVPAQDKVALRWIDHDVLVSAIIARAKSLDNQKYVQGSIVAGSVLAAGAAWKYWPQGKKPESGTSGVASVVPTDSQDSQNLFARLWKHGTSSFGTMFITVFAGVLANQLGLGISTFGMKNLRKLWFGINNCSFFGTLAMVSLNSYDGLLLRRAQGVTRGDSDLMARYNQFIVAFERYVTELAAHTAYLSKKHGISCDGLDQLLVQFVRDVDSVNQMLENLEVPLPVEEARGKNLCSFVLETVSHIKELHAQLGADFDQEKAGQDYAQSLY